MHQKPLPDKIKIPSNPYLTIFCEEVLLLKEKDVHALLNSKEFSVQELSLLSAMDANELIERWTAFEKISINLDKETVSSDLILDIDQLEAIHFPKVLKDAKGKTVVCISKNNKRAASAALFLRSKGYDCFAKKTYSTGFKA